MNMNEIKKGRNSFSLFSKLTSNYFFFAAGFFAAGFAAAFFTAGFFAAGFAAAFFAAGFAAAFFAAGFFTAIEFPP
jgi:hypothetical protein